MKTRKNKNIIFSEKVVGAVFVLLFVLLNFGSVNYTDAYFTDVEWSNNNEYHASVLDIELHEEEDFLPTISAIENRTRLIHVENAGTLPLNYNIFLNTYNSNSPLCELLELDLTWNGASIYNGTLKNFKVYNIFLDIGPYDELLFDVGLNGNISASYNECNFSFIFRASQLTESEDSLGFKDDEVSVSVISSGSLVVETKQAKTKDIEDDAVILIEEENKNNKKPKKKEVDDEELEAGEDEEGNDEEGDDEVVDDFDAVEEDCKDEVDQEEEDFVEEEILDKEKNKDKDKDKDSGEEDSEEELNNDKEEEEIVIEEEEFLQGEQEESDNEEEALEEDVELEKDTSQEEGTEIESSTEEDSEPAIKETSDTETDLESKPEEEAVTEEETQKEPEPEPEPVLEEESEPELEEEPVLEEELEPEAVLEL